MSEKKIADMGKTIKTVEEELNHTSSSITANVSEQVQNIERRQNITNLDSQERISKSSTQGTDIIRNSEKNNVIKEILSLLIQFDI